ncbi:protein artichoke-like [Sitodiplosis mosellana]|uniref:protein artichoke-like n=1 Tax=Sitodiplosis mosellana TaxID=263140 RepID=UPI002445123F|nr:protein artichoke-like [Sitodiplosis mosellana]
MRFVIACAFVLILAKGLHGCIEIPGFILSKNHESRYIFCNESFDVRHNECDYSSVKVLKIQNCSAKWIDFRLNVYQNLRTLDISFSNYTKFDQIYLNFYYLKRFNVSYNNLTEVHDNLFFKTTQLKEVDFSHNQIKELHKLTFLIVSKLSIINVSHNQIEEIDSDVFSELSDLEELDLSDNKIRWISYYAFPKNSKLKTLNLKNNPIRRLDCSITRLLNGVTSINVSFENVTVFDLSCANPMEWAVIEKEIIFKNANNKNELRYPKIDFKHLRGLSISGNQLQNPQGIVELLGESIQYLHLGGNILGEVNKTAFQGLSNLIRLYISDTSLSFTESNPFENLNELTELDISYNNLTTLNISLLSKSLSNLRTFNGAGNQFNNSVEIIHSLGSNLEHLDLSQNIIGTLNRSTFEHLWNLTALNLSDTHLEHFDVKLHEVRKLDISRNQLKQLNASLLRHTSKKLWLFHAADNNFENTAEIIRSLGIYIESLDLSGNYVGKLDETTFKQPSLIWLSLRRTNLSIPDVKPFEAFKAKLVYLDISCNNLTRLNFFTSDVFSHLKKINLSENQLTQLDGLTEDSYPQLTELDITNNQMNCTYPSMFREQWEKIDIIGDPCQFENIETQNQTDTSLGNTSIKNITESATITTFQIENDSEAQTKFTIPPSVPSSSSVVPYVVSIGWSALIIINIVAVVVFLRRKSSSKSSEQMQVSYRRNDNGEELQPEPQHELHEELNPEDHIYEEIEERERLYDHLEFGVRPMPISTENQHYHNFTLANRDRGTQPQNI